MQRPNPQEKQAMPRILRSVLIITVIATPGAATSADERVDPDALSASLKRRWLDCLWTVKLESVQRSEPEHVAHVLEPGRQ
jgi:hypothetical protein